MAWNDKVVWSEGMFLKPQHFQQQDRHFERLLEGRTRPLASHAWGFSEIELDNAALALGKIQLTTARGILPDGTPFDFPQHDEPPLPLDVGADVRDETIVLGVPVHRPGTAENYLADGHDASLARFTVANYEADDVNANARSICV
jgi:type VI secretion system protein ImpJ